MAMLSSSLSRPILLGIRTMQWASSVIALGIYAYFVHHQRSGTNPIFNLVISVLKWVALIDMVFSYLWLTAFVLAAQSYNYGDVYLKAPSGVRVSIKHAAESFTFLAFIFTFFGLLTEVATRWTDADDTPVTREKHNGDTRAPLDAPANPTGPAAV
ncbi:hypothetical protein EYB25_009972 [Talaromyces marneffei]|uniref:uncharacterized protein n=1 Tax=Talaromyces marneffei TaxID=37727 RepID=UPI0012A78A0A|nr:uncharacterized protein EYB26_009237 [Talaromyces marneffei]KAE8548178.1 hypothetical protein EYB25_009972 [Talaromyces marneffei]QGA21526.1 hypothetical protein EYB26_009237 [Talaromyces marneffei]